MCSCYNYMTKTEFCGFKLVREVEAGVEVDFDVTVILGIGTAKLTHDAVFELELFAVKVVDDEVKGDDFLLVVDIEAMGLKDSGLAGDDFLEATTHGLVGLGLAVFGVNTNGEVDTELREGALGDFVGETVDVPRSEAIGDLDVDGADIGVRTVIVKDEVVGTVDLWKTADKIIETARKFGIMAATDDV